MLDTSRLVQYTPSNLRFLDDIEVRDRAAVAANTVTWWKKAHDQNTPYHQQFTGYCCHCPSPGSKSS